jgi:twitching motility protein PilT
MVQIRDWTKSTFEPEADIEINKIFRMAVKMGCSDIHLQVGHRQFFVSEEH